MGININGEIEPGSTLGYWKSQSATAATMSQKIVARCRIHVKSTFIKGQSFSPQQPLAGQ
jgi:hypothetical protein